MRPGFVLIGSLALLLLHGVPLADSIYHIPVQPSEVVDIVQYVDDTSGVAAAFTLGLHASRTMLRPLRQAHTKMLLALATWLGGRHHLAFRGVHVLLALALLALFAAAARPQTPADLAALAFALAVLIGLHTFLGMTREAYPVNHFLVVAVYGLATLVLAQSRGGLAADGAAAISVALALFTLESGLLVALVAFAAYAAGLRGISRRGLVLVAAMVLVYLVIRLLYLGIESPPFAERATGFGLTSLSSEEQVERFGDRKWVLYAYTSTGAVLSILFSQPRDGIWTIASRWQDGSLPAWMIIHIASSAIATGLILWFTLRLQHDGRRGYRDPLVAVAAIVVAANGALGFSYAKDEIVSFGGVFYALAAYAAMRGSLRHHGALSPRGRGALGVLVLAGAVLWSARIAGNHYVLREQAFHVRNDWAYLRLGAGTAPLHPRVRALNAEALAVHTLTPRLLDRRISTWLGER